MKVPSRPMCRMFVFAALLAVAGCSAPKPEPQIARSTGEPGYVMTLPKDIDATIAAFVEHQAEARTLTSRFGSFGGELKDADGGQVAAVYARADQAGQGSGYAQRAHELEATTAFFQQEKDEINKKVGGV